MSPLRALIDVNNENKQFGRGRAFFNAGNETRARSTEKLRRGKEHFRSATQDVLFAFEHAQQRSSVFFTAIILMI